MIVLSLKRKYSSGYFPRDVKMEVECNAKSLIFAVDVSTRGSNLKYYPDIKGLDIAICFEDELLRSL